MRIAALSFIVLLAGSLNALQAGTFYTNLFGNGSGSANVSLAGSLLSLNLNYTGLPGGNPSLYLSAGFPGSYSLAPCFFLPAYQGFNQSCSTSIFDGAHLSAYQTSTVYLTLNSSAGSLTGSGWLGPPQVGSSPPPDEPEVPEPSTAGLLLLGIAGLTAAWRRRQAGTRSRPA